MRTARRCTRLVVRGTIPAADAVLYNKGQVVDFKAQITGIDTFLLFAVKVGPITIIE